MPERTLIIAEQEIRFNPTQADHNQFVNEFMPNDKVTPSFNFLMRCVHDDDKAALKRLILSDDNVTPKGMAVVNLANTVAAGMSDQLEISIKKPSSLPSE